MRRSPVAEQTSLIPTHSSCLIPITPRPALHHLVLLTLEAGSVWKASLTNLSRQMHTAVRGTINVVGEMYETHFRFQISLAGQGSEAVWLCHSQDSGPVVLEPGRVCPAETERIVS